MGLFVFSLALALLLVSPLPLVCAQGSPGAGELGRLQALVEEADASASFQKRPFALSETSDLPDTFDFREAHGECSAAPKSMTEECDASFAIMAADSFAERLCLSRQSHKSSSQGDIGVSMVELSAQMLLSCDTGDNGCSGGSADRALRYLVGNGVSPLSCFPNNLTAATPCPLTCEDGSSITQTAIFPSAFYRLSGADAFGQIYEELLRNGPLIARMHYSADLESYASGIFSHFSSEFEGYFWVRILGWGVLNNTSYWIVATPFGPDFGDNGVMYVARGTNESGIEEMVYAVVPEEI